MDRRPEIDEVVTVTFADGRQMTAPVRSYYPDGTLSVAGCRVMLSQVAR